MVKPKQPEILYFKLLILKAQELCLEGFACMTYLLQLAVQFHVKFFVVDIIKMYVYETHNEYLKRASSRLDLLWVCNLIVYKVSYCTNDRSTYSNGAGVKSAIPKLLIISHS